MTTVGAKTELADLRWTVGDGVRQVLGRAARMNEVKEVRVETMSLGELMYYALVGTA